MHWIIDFDKRLFLGINGQHAESVDPVMLFFSSYTSWGVIACLIFCYVLYVKSKEIRWVAACFLFLAVVSTNLFNQLVKVLVERPRPIHETAFTDIIHAIEKFDASYSFFSAHSSSSFALAIFAALAVGKKWFTISVVSWAFLVAYSRIYVGKHYPIDVVVGILFGSLMAVFWWRLYKYYKKRKTNKNYVKEKNY
jgi:Membrane-associated phospholipid phosphatase